MDGDDSHLSLGQPTNWRQIWLAVALLFMSSLPAFAETQDHGRLPALAEAARSQADQCWRKYRFPADSGKVDPFRVIAVLDEGGLVRSSMLLDVDARRGGAPAQQLVDNALASLKTCRFALPRDLYDLWKTMTFTFDPALS
ncbi:hypothetical protein SAMN07250955_103304 [Arboricoccus pini]|uniref:TonB C terminal n=1 Tax=Arboricoccus pini TaxID=1963835 RepID=A0A212QUE1_9PROT|nr:hypothetical protein [Arboricoccus pini]SNB63305.1 hypothetical protein SAMN07250955_103304 [Arboricoccus pini]